MSDPQTIISARIQNRRGLRQHLPQPLLPGELGLATDTGQLFIGADPSDPASITSPIIEIYNDYIIDTISNQEIENSYVTIANQLLGTVPNAPATFYINTVNGSGAEFTGIEITESGSITDVTVTSPGSGYTSSSTTTASAINRFGPDILPGQEAQFNVSVVSGKITNIEVVSGGAGYTDPVIIITDPTPSATGASFNIRIDIGQVISTSPTGITIVDGGSGYTASDTLEIAHPYGTGFVAQLTVVAGEITEINILTSGNNYQPVPYGYVVRVDLNYEYTNSLGNTVIGTAPLPSVNTNPDLLTAQEVMYIPEYSRITDNYSEHNWIFIAYSTPFGKTPLPSFEYEYTTYSESSPGSGVFDLETTATGTLTAKLIPYPFSVNPFDNDPYYAFVGKTLDMSLQFPGDASYNSADAAALAHAINWAFNNGLSGFEYVQQGAVASYGITAATGRGTGLVTVVQNIEVQTDRGNKYNTELATLVRGLQATTSLANNDAFNTGLEFRFPTPAVTVADGIMADAAITNEGSGYLFPVVAIQDSLSSTITPLTTNDGSEVIELDLNRSITSIVVDTQGSGYDPLTPPEVLISDEPRGTGAVLTPVVLDGVIAKITVENAGIGYTDADYKIFCAKSNPLDPVDFDVVVTNGRVSAVTINYGGEGFIRPRLFIFDKPVWSTPTATFIGTLASNEEIIPILRVSGIVNETGVTVPDGTVTIANANQVSSLGLTPSQPIIISTGGVFDIQTNGEDFTVSSTLSDLDVYNIEQAYNPVTNDKPYVKVNGSEVVGLSVKFSIADLVLVKDGVVVSSVGSDFSPTTTNALIIDVKGDPDTYADVNVEVVNNQIVDVTMINDGAGYYVPLVIVTGPGTGASATPEVRNGAISSVVVDAPGQFYSIETFNVNGQAEATATQTAGEINAITFTTATQGAGYIRSPSVTITDASGNGAGATAVASITNTLGKSVGHLTSIDIVNAGAGYVDPIVTLSPPDTEIRAIVNTETGTIDRVEVVDGGAGYFTGTGQGASATASVSGGEITAIAVLDGGTGYADPTVTIESTSGTGALATAVVLGGSIVSINIDDPGTGYTSASISITDDRIVSEISVADPGPGSGAIASAIISNVILSATVSTGGSGYSSSPTVTISDPTGTGAVLTPVVSSGIITSIDVTSSGSGYSSSPTVTIADSTGTGATATVTTDNVLIGIDITNGGNNYINPSVEIIDTIGSGASATANYSIITTATVLPANYKLQLTANETLVIYDKYEAFGAPYAGGTGALITPFLSNGVITDVSFTSTGQYGLGYISDPVITVESADGSGAKLEAVVTNNIVDNISIISGGAGYPTDTTLNLLFSPPDGLRSTGIWYDLDEADAFSIKYSIKNSTDVRKGEISVITLGQDYILEDSHLQLTSDSDPLKLTFVPAVDIINNIIEIKYSANTLPSEAINPTSLSTNTLRWKNF